MRTRRQHAVVIATFIASIAHPVFAQRNSAQARETQASAQDFAPAVRVALAAIPWDSICDDVRCTVIQVDSRLRSMQTRTGITPLSPTLERISDDTIAAWGTAQYTFRSAAFIRTPMRHDTISVVVGVQAPIRTDELAISILIHLPDGASEHLALVDLERRSGLWKISRTRIIEG